MKIAVVGETRPGERRVALVPGLVSRLTDVSTDVSADGTAEVAVAVEPGAGAAAGYTDDDYRQAGAVVAGDALRGADVVLSVQPIPEYRIGELAPGAITISFLPAAQELDLVRALRDGGHTALAMELVPRISRAQAMDALSSQSFVAGYRAAVVAAERLPRFLPLSMTASGTIRPATVLVLGAGVAGLQAIATSRRLGAVVRAYDVRAASAEEVRSLGAEFVELDLPTLEGTGGYAREMTEERSRLQRELLAPHVADADVLITTASVPGRTAPILVTEEMVAAMRPGSVVVDLAAESGGNVEGAKPGEEVTIGGVLVWGGANVPSQLPAQASQLYSTNVVNLLLHLRSGGAPTIDFDDEIVAGCCVTHAGEVRHAPTRELLDNPVS
ncbi:NAD(P) transhydrogenase subunit alpha [Actinophytocola algeriensis]|uniref:proton-translocating NAD(P)(+) transhydrogenase n=1 Tax=Actinophytocola algeriensis TaxID=1768010 RepID=A0A7W7QCJ5_9PSEU|nr:NAD(P) transhydrogenase subunit alpha [Actinophytocola algeriensis]MBB4910943.1 NAD(P) transhydrogenase subunit alpha [Actinophytocola algeriensis]MBE1473936.1 NAD(P) transhydrogenase subunit alpha [Actinophytocola algeriensis]